MIHVRASVRYRVSLGLVQNLVRCELDSIAWSLLPRFRIVALAGLQGWLFRKATQLERWMLVIAGLMLAYPAPLFDYIGFALVAAVVVLQKFRSAPLKPAMP